MLHLVSMAMTYQEALAQHYDTNLLAMLISGEKPDGTALATVGKFNAGFMALGQSAKQFVGKVTTKNAGGAVVQAIQTVSAGKTFYITDIFMNTDAASATSLLDVTIKAASTPIFQANCHSLSPISVPGIETQPFGTTGQAIALEVAQAGEVKTLWYNIYGFEQ